MSAWIDNTLDELDAHLRELERDVARREWEVAHLEARGPARSSDLNAHRLVRAAAPPTGAISRSR